VDSLKGGSGIAVDWTRLQLPPVGSTRGWLLAGGLTPDNVGKAIRAARPNGVDVSSGVCGPDGSSPRLSLAAAECNRFKFVQHWFRIIGPVLFWCYAMVYLGVVMQGGGRMLPLFAAL
jgi:N-(5'phosphoribosyl)anthranilate (PRA) isomerase